MYTDLESELNHDHDLSNENFDPNSIIMKIFAHETDDKNTIARLKYHIDQVGEMGKEVKVATCRPKPITTWTIFGDIKSADVPETIEKHNEIGIVDFDYSDKEVTSGVGGKYGQIKFLRLCIHVWPGD